MWAVDGLHFRKVLRLPRLLGMILTGILLGPSVLNWLDGSVLSISADLRQIALIIILTRAGLSLNIKDLKKVGRPAVLMCFVPACFEIGGMLLLAPPLLGISLLDAAIMGSSTRSGIASGYRAENAQTDGNGLWSEKEYSPNDFGGSFRR